MSGPFATRTLLTATLAVMAALAVPQVAAAQEPPDFARRDNVDFSCGSSRTPTRIAWSASGATVTATWSARSRRARRAMSRS